jgi:DHA1 family multidrug resistance protein-like MFS transporter
MSLARRNFIAVWCSNFITSVGMMSFLPLIPLYAAEIGAQGEAAVRIWSGVLIAAAPLPAALMAPVWGSLGDRIGRKLMMVRANLAILVFVGLMAVVVSPWQMLALRLGQGVFSGFIAPAMTLVSLSAPADRQGRTAANLQTALMAGGIVGPLLGGLVGDAYGYRAVFVVCSALSFVGTLIIVFLVKEPEARQQAQPEGAPGTAVAGAGAQEADGAVGRSRTHLRRVDILAVFQSALRDVVEFLRSPVLRVILAGAFAVRFAASLVDPVLVLWVETRTGFDPEFLATTTGFVVGAQAVATLIFTPFWGRLGDSMGNRKLLAVCAAGAGLAYLVQLFVMDVTMLAVLRFVSGAFVAGVVPAAFAAASVNSPMARRGAAHGVTFSAIVMARALAPLGGGFLAAAVGLEPLFIVAAVLMLLTAGVALRSAITYARRQVDPLNN